jgi:hypothetical protein
MGDDEGEPAIHSRSSAGVPGVGLIGARQCVGVAAAAPSGAHDQPELGTVRLR